MPETPRPSREAPLPNHIELSHEGANLVLEIRWFRLMHLTLVAFTIFWDGFLVHWYSTLLSMPVSRSPQGLPPASGSSFPFLLPLLHVGIGIGLTYNSIAHLLNRTRVSIGSGSVDVRIGPVPWLGSKRVDASEITQVFCEEIVGTGRGSRTSYRVNAITPQNRKLTLVSGLTDWDVALYLEQEIEKALGIADEKVRGEPEK